MMEENKARLDALKAQAEYMEALEEYNREQGPHLKAYYEEQKTRKSQEARKAFEVYWAVQEANREIKNL